MRMTSNFNSRMAEAVKQIITFISEFRDLDEEQFSDLLTIMREVWDEGDD